MNLVLVKRLKEGMALLERETALIKEKREVFEKTLEYHLTSKKALETDLNITKSQLTDEALTEFKDTGKKKLLGGIGIREGSTINYDSKKALEFAKEKMMFLSLDKKAFEKVAGSLSLDFVTIGTKATVTFPKVVDCE